MQENQIIVWKEIVWVRFGYGDRERTSEPQCSKALTEQYKEFLLYTTGLSGVSDRGRSVHPLLPLLSYLKEDKYHTRLQKWW